MEPGGSMSHSQGPSNNPNPEPNQPISSNWYSLTSILILSSHLRLGLPKGLYPVGLPVMIFKLLITISKPSYSFKNVVHVFEQNKFEEQEEYITHCDLLVITCLY